MRPVRMLLPHTDRAARESMRGFWIPINNGNRRNNVWSIALWWLWWWMSMEGSLAFVGTPRAGQGHSTVRNVASTTTVWSSSHSNTLGLLTFDLDDTLFPTSETVNDANAVQLDRMNEWWRNHQHQYQQGDDNNDTPFTLPAFLQTTRTIRSGLDTPVTYTALRKLAIRAELAQQLEKESAASTATATIDELDRAADDLFEAWLQERHDAAERYLFSDAIESLTRLRARHPGVCMAAITNGRGNPLDMPDTLADFFEFCVSGEDDDVFPHRKPHRGIYDVALERYWQRYPDRRGDGTGDDDDAQQSSSRGGSSRIPGGWVHVGDCLANDVGASADCGAQAVWLCPDTATLDAAAAMVQKDNGSTGGDGGGGGIEQSPAEPSWSTASAEEQSKRKELADRAQEKVATRISCLSELEDAIEELLEAVPSDV